MHFVSKVRSQIQYKIILPFLLLTLLVALASVATAMLFITNNAQDRLNNQLAQAARTTSDGVIELERANLLFLREIAFAGAVGDVPAVPDAFASGDTKAVSQALEAYFAVIPQRQGIRVDRLIAFDTKGMSIVDWEYTERSAAPITHPSSNLNKLWFVPRILGKQSDPLGDKYSGLLDIGDQQQYLFTVAPVVSRSGNVVGGILLASQLDAVLQQLSQRSSAAIVSVYQAEDGRALASSQVPAAGLTELTIRSDLLPSVRSSTLAEHQAIFDTVSVNQRNYQFAYLPLSIRSSVVGLLSVALSSDYVIGPWSEAGVPLFALTAALMLAIICLGIYIARQITRPLEELAITAEAVTSGDFERRSTVASSDEVGVLSRSFNKMTEYLVESLHTVRVESSQRAAIVESIADGVVVCDQNGQILVMNKAMRGLLQLEEQQDGPSQFYQIPLAAMDENALAFNGTQTPDLYSINNRVVRVAAAPVTTNEGVRLGDVYVFQDLTSEVAIDRAKTNFIATISHELRTPLTVLGGSSDLLLRGFIGELNDEQRSMIAAMQKHTQAMTALLNNVIVIAGLESGTLEFELTPLPLCQVIDNALWSLRPGFRSRNLDLQIDIAEDLPEVMADELQLKSIFHQLLDNARRYTTNGCVTIRVYPEAHHVRVDISDTGPGIDNEVSANLFHRFVRGAEGINSSERGIGLGLAITKMLIERQNGTIWLDHTSDNGTTFSFTLQSVHADLQTNNRFLARAA